MLPIQHQALQRANRFHRRGVGEIVDLLALLHVAHGCPLPRNGFHTRFVRRVRHQPEVAPQQRVGILQRKPRQIVARPAAKAGARVVAVVEFVVAHAQVDVRRTEAFLAPRKQAAQSRRHGEVLLFVDHKLDEVWRFQVGQGKRAGASDLIAHRLKNGVWGRRLRAQHAQRGQCAKARHRD